jgi:hypothetical protein
MQDAIISYKHEQEINDTKVQQVYKTADVNNVYIKSGHSLFAVDTIGFKHEIHVY